MIEDEILEVIESRSDNGERLNGIVDQFRCGREVTELSILLSSRYAEVVSIGAWILSELPFELYDSDDLVSLLRELTDHEDPTVRFNAFSALFPALDSRETSTQALVRKLRDDPNEGVRRSAESAASRLSLD